MNIKIFSAVCLLSLWVTFGAQPSYAINVVHNQIFPTSFAAEKFLRTELYFGVNISDGGEVTEEDWAKFLDEEVAPKFPEGFTVVAAYGQFRDKEGKIGKEKSRMLILLYPRKTKLDANAKIEAIRAAYIKAFKQESVMRMDLPQAVLVSF